MADGILQFLRDQVALGRIGFTALVSVRGTLLRGTVIGPDEYLDLLSAQFSQGQGDLADVAMWRDGFRSVATMVRGELDQVVMDDDPPPSDFLHLRDVRILAPTGIVEQQLARVLFDMIDMWSLG